MYNELSTMHTNNEGFKYVGKYFQIVLIENVNLKNVKALIGISELELHFIKTIYSHF